MYKYILVALKLGLLSFGGPTAHLGYFMMNMLRKENGLMKRILRFSSAMPVLPGPASSQVGIGIGTIRGGILGGIISFIGFTLPSVIILMVFSIIY